MILKLLIDFYRWMWGLPPIVIHTVSETVAGAIFWSVLIDLVVLVGIIGSAITIYNDRKKAR